MQLEVLIQSFIFVFEFAPDLLLCGPACKQRWHHETQTQRCKAQSNHGTWPHWCLSRNDAQKKQTHFTLSVVPDSLPGAKQDMRPGDAEFKHGCVHESAIVTPRNCQVPCCHHNQQQLKAPSTCNSPLVWNQKRWDQPMEPWQFQRCFGMIANKMLPNARNYPRMFNISISKNNNQDKSNITATFSKEKFWTSNPHFETTLLRLNQDTIRKPLMTHEALGASSCQVEEPQRSGQQGRKLPGLGSTARWLELFQSKKTTTCCKCMLQITITNMLKNDTQLLFVS